MRLHGGLRSRHRVLFYRSVGAIRLRQPTGHRRLEPGPVRRNTASVAADDIDEGIALAEESFGVFATVYDTTWSSGMRAKLGLPADVPAEVRTPLVDELLRLLQESRVDYTSFFRHLGDAARGDTAAARGLFIDLAGFDAWMSSWQALGPDAESMDRANPIYIPRNHLVEEALTAATAGDLRPVGQLLDAVSAPYRQTAGLRPLRQPGPGGFRQLPNLLRHLRTFTRVLRTPPAAHPNGEATRRGARSPAPPRRARLRYHGIPQRLSLSIRPREY